VKRQSLFGNHEETKRTKAGRNKEAKPVWAVFRSCFVRFGSSWFQALVNELFADHLVATKKRRARRAAAAVASYQDKSWGSLPLLRALRRFVVKQFCSKTFLINFTEGGF
jgi:hypothetical protein